MRRDDVTRIYQRNAAWYDLMHGPMERLAVGRWRSRALEGLSGSVLELGVGTGANFRHHGRPTRLTAMDPSPRMLDRARPRRSRRACWRWSGHGGLPPPVRPCPLRGRLATRLCASGTSAEH